MKTFTSTPVPEWLKQRLQAAMEPAGGEGPPPE
jgi:hypothetical protein